MNDLEHIQEKHIAGDKIVGFDYLQKTDDVHPPKTVISVHFLYSLS